MRPLPGARDPTVVASAYATLQDISDGRMVMGIGRGDSARRYINQKPVPVAEFEDAIRMIKPFAMNGERALERHGPPAQLGAAGAADDRDARRGLRPSKSSRLAGRYRDGVIIQLADPDIITWTMEHGQDGWRRQGTGGVSSSASSARSLSPTTSNARLGALFSRWSANHVR